MIDFVETLWAFVKDKGYIKCERCGLYWTFESFCRMSKEDQKRLKDGDGCLLCYKENWKDGKEIKNE